VQDRLMKRESRNQQQSLFPGLILIVITMTVCLRDSRFI